MKAASGTSAATVRPSICRTCQMNCPTLVSVDNGKIVSITGDSSVPLYRGYTCVKGREHARLYGHPERLLRPLKRMSDGSLQSISLRSAIDEVAEKIQLIIDRHGPESVALYQGNHCAFGHPANVPVSEAFMAAIGSHHTYTVVPLDQPGKFTSLAFHGKWMAPGHKSKPDVILVVGNNALVSHQGQAGPPNDLLKDLSSRNGSLLVIDPRRTETANRARIHLAPRPGMDAAILAGILHVIIEENLYDQEFVSENVDGLETLRENVAPYTPQYVAQRVDIPVDHLVEVARIFGTARRGYALAGTGPSMAGHSTLVEYLCKALDTVCGHWSRAGDMVEDLPCLLPYSEPRAQAIPPFPIWGRATRVRGLFASTAGMPTAALPDEILTPGQGQVRALLSLGGNPAVSWPDETKAVSALRSLDLLVHTDIQMTGTAELAHYIFPSTLPYETPGLNQICDLAPVVSPFWGTPRSFARYTDALVAPPSDSEVADIWKVVYLLAQRMGVQLSIAAGMSELISETPAGSAAGDLHMSRVPTSAEMIEISLAGSRIPLEEIKRHPRGLMPREEIRVLPKQEGWEGRLDVGNQYMMEELHSFLKADVHDNCAYPFRLLCRRMTHVFNTRSPARPTNRPDYNPIFVHPADMVVIGVVDGAMVEIRSEHAAIFGIVASDDTLRMGTVAMSHGFGGLRDADRTPRRTGSNTGRLIANDSYFERYSGQPRMSNIPVALRPVTEEADC